ncbi:MAG: hypothetical protein ACP5IL_04185 [Syntrophobacteraceae bacterium]
MKVNAMQRDQFKDGAAFRNRVIEVLSKVTGNGYLSGSVEREGERTSSVLLLLGEFPPRKGAACEPGIILNKRSQSVRQPGDLCCPGGSLEKLDNFLARLLAVPGSTLSKWPAWPQLKDAHPQDAAFLSLLYAAALREGWEEMRINPFGLTFLGVLPTERLVMYKRSIHPMAVWMSGQKRFRLNCEVERIVRFPLRALLDTSNYGCYRIDVPSRINGKLESESADFPCFVYPVDGRKELLWGATFRIVTQFLEMIFGFKVPEISCLPLILGRLDKHYMTGSAQDSGCKKHRPAPAPGHHHPH